MQRRTFSCEGTRRILQERGSRSNEPVEKRLICEGLRFEQRLHKIRNTELNNIKNAIPKIDKNSEKIAQRKGCCSIYQKYLDILKRLFIMLY